jgi:hypothetical protein
LEELKQHGVAPQSTDQFLETLTVMNKAVHGLKTDANDLARAITIGTELLAELSASGARLDAGH